MSMIFNSRGNQVPEVSTGKSTGTAAVNLSVTPAGAFRILSLTAHASSSTAEALAITLDSKEGAAYDTVLSSNTNWTDVYVAFDESAIFEKGDIVKITCTNAVTTKSVILRYELL